MGPSCLISITAGGVGLMTSALKTKREKNVKKKFKLKWFDSFRLIN